jgi:enamine deaminase RidA (YjgF/YER057c/UK114 family)
MNDRVEINPDWPWAKNYRISQAVRVGTTIYVSGQVAFDRDGKVVGGNNMGEQSRQVFANIREILSVAGASMDDVVKITAFLVDLSRYSEYSAARAEAFPNNIPASTAVSAPSLVMPDFLVEVEAVAETGSGG